MPTCSQQETSTRVTRQQHRSIVACNLTSVQDNSRVRKVSRSGTISTLAGNGTAAFGGDGGAATSAALNQPVAIAIDAFNNVFISDSVRVGD